MCAHVYIYIYIYTYMHMCLDVLNVHGVYIYKYIPFPNPLSKIEGQA